jgi:PBP1b-binding outer membrane lipoprotein LpoB
LGGRSRLISEFEASLGYRVSSRTARATQRNPVSKNKNKTNKQKTQQQQKQIACPCLRLLLRLSLLVVIVYSSFTQGTVNYLFALRLLNVALLFLFKVGRF